MTSSDRTSRLEVAQRAARVPGAVDSLEPGGRALLLLAYHHGLSDADIARRARLDPTLVAPLREEQLDEVVAATGLPRAAVVAGLDYVSLPGPASPAAPRTPAAATAVAPRSRRARALAALGYRLPLALIVVLAFVSVLVGLGDRAGEPQSLGDRNGPKAGAVQVAASPKQHATPNVPRPRRPATATADNSHGTRARPSRLRSRTPAPSPRERLAPAGRARPGSGQRSFTRHPGGHQQRSPVNGKRPIAKTHAHSRGGTTTSARPPSVVKDRQPRTWRHRGPAQGHPNHGRPHRSRPGPPIWSHGRHADRPATGHHGRGPQGRGHGRGHGRGGDVSREPVGRRSSRGPRG